MFNSRFLVASVSLIICISVAAQIANAQTTAPASKPAIATTKPTVEGATEAAPANRPVFAARHALLVEQANKGNIDVYFLGDSITHGWINRPKQWEKYFGDLKPGNFGIGGDRTGNVLWRLQNGELPEVCQPKVFVVMIGTNNTAVHSGKEIAEGVTAIVKLLRQERPDAKVLLLAIFPRGEKPNVRRDKNDEANKIIANLADGKMIRFMDIGDKLMNPDGTISPDMMKDYLHLTEKGYDIWGESIRPVLLEMLGRPVPATQSKN